MRGRTGVRWTAAVLLAGCTPAGQACTEIGCVGGLVVQFTRPPAAPYRVEAIAPGAAPAVFECAAGESCSSALLEGVEAERVTIRVATSAGTRAQEFRPAYQEQYPNGRRCPAACRQATITFRL